MSDAENEDGTRAMSGNGAPVAPIVFVERGGEPD